ncbi:MAG: hypothetical protein K2H09_01230 [Treponemataceae bacterium]|nr:hypothetical protein [Treponemataceae bacterium]
MKRLLIFAAALCAAPALFAYNPPAGGQSMFVLSSPTQLTSASSAAGGGIFAPGPDSIAFNPALPAHEQRTQLDADFTALISPDDSGSPFHSAFQTGILIPTKLFVISSMLNGVFCSADDMNLGNSLNAKVGLSKEVSERLSVGLALSGGGLWGAGSDWALGVDVGVLYRRERLGFLKDFRIGVSLLNLGKYYSTELLGIDAAHRSDSFPALATLRAGVASLLFETDVVCGGFSFDISAPTFQNAVFDVGFQVGFKDVFFVSVAESIDVREAVEGHYNFMPAVGLGVKFNFSAKNSAYLRSRSWDTSEMLVSAAWQQRYESVQAVSAGLKIKLGQKDTQPPVIQIWNGEN